MSSLITLYSHCSTGHNEDVGIYSKITTSFGCLCGFIKHLYTAYLTYPDDLDQRIRTIYKSITKKWPNKLTFEFKPMIPVWKVLLEQKYEDALVKNITKVATDLNIPLKTKGLITKDYSGYIFVTFNTESSKSLISYSDEIRIAMRTPGYEDYMHYAYEPHTSVIKKDPLVLGAIMNSITDSLEDIIFTPKECIISRETKTEKGSVFDIIYTHQF